MLGIESQALSVYRQAHTTNLHIFNLQADFWERSCTHLLSGWSGAVGNHVMQTHCVGK